MTDTLAPWHSLVAEVLALEEGTVAGRGSTTSFLALGGTSLRAIELISRGQRQHSRIVDIGRLLADAPLDAALAAATDSVPDTPAPVPPGDGYPASAGQLAILGYHELFGAAPFGLLFSADIRGPLSTARLEAAVATVTRRHESLRTVFADKPTGPAAAAGRCHLVPGGPEVLRQRLAWPAGDPVAEVHAQLAPSPEIDPYRQPVRFVLTEAGLDRHVLTVVAHHAVLDGWSIGRLFSEIFQRYGGGADRGPAPSPRLVAMEENRPGVRELADRRVAELADATNTDAPGVPDTGGDRTDRRGVRLHFRLSAVVRTAVEELAASVRVTRNAVLLAAWALTLARRTGATVELISVAAAGRTADTADLVGLVTRDLLVPCRTDDTTVVAFLRGVADAQTAALRAAAVPTRWLLDRLPRLAVRFSFAPHDELIPPSISCGDLDVSLVEGHCLGAAYDATLFVQAWEGEPRLALEYRLTALEPAAAAALAESFAATLSELAAAGPDVALATVRGLSAGQRRELEAWGDGGISRSEVGLWEFVEEVAARHPDDPAVNDPAAGRGLTYRQLIAAAEAQAAELAAAGVRDGDRVGLMIPRCTAEIVAVLAVLRCGAAYVALDPAAPAEVTRHALTTAAPSVVLASVDGGAGLAGWTALAPRDPWDHIGRTDPPPAPPADPGRVAYVGFTSGSSGRAKGVQVPQRGVVRLVTGADYLVDGGIARFARLAPLTFDASTFEIFATLGGGGCLEVFPPRTPSGPALSRFLTERGITGCLLTTGLFRLLVAYHVDAFAGVRQVLTGGDVGRADDFRRLLHAHPGLRLIHVYGPTENTVFSSIDVVDSGYQVTDPPRIGRPVAGSTAVVLDPAGWLLPAGAVGELYVGGSGLAVDYLGEPDLTAKSFGPFAEGPHERLYRTGDLVRWDAYGHLVFVGRADDQVKIRGFRVEPAGVERVLREHPEATDAAVLVVRDGVDARLAAVVTPGSTPVERLRDWAVHRLPAHEVPALWVTVDAMPLRTNGKLDLDALRALVGGSARLAEPLTTASAPLPEPDLTDLVVSVWAEVLGTKEFGLDDPFFDVGGDSLLLTAVRARLRDALPTARFTALDLFRYPTISTLVLFLRERTGPEVLNVHNG
jgi:amino acid adenylation domain-containing protein